MQPWAPDQPDSMGAALKVHEGETIYDYCWYSRMHASDPLSCCFASTSRVGAAVCGAQWMWVWV